MNNKVNIEKIISVCKKIGCDEFISNLPHRYSTILTENINISSGEKQKIALARGVINDADILLMDESTSNMDLISEKIIYDNILEYYSDKTVVVVSHRVSSIKDFKKIIVLNNGKIEAIGDHKKLLEMSNTYRKLVKYGG